MDSGYLRRPAFAVRALLALLATLAVSSAAGAQPLQYRLDTVSAWGGAVNAFERVGNIGYCGSGQRFVVLDMSNEANIQETGSVKLQATVQDFAVRGNYVYTLCSGEPYFFSVIDVSSPASPRIAWTETKHYPNTMLAPNAVGATTIEVYGNIAYLLRSSTVWAYDLSNPVAPVALVTGPPIFPGQPPRFDVFFGSGPNLTLPEDVQVIGDHAYTIGKNILGGGGWFLSVFDLGPDPIHPTTLVGKIQIPEATNGTRHLAVADGRAVVQIQDGQTSRVVRVVDVSDPAHPVVRGAFIDLVRANGVAVQGNYAFVADWLANTLDPPSSPAWNILKGLAVLDISNPDVPLLVGTYNPVHSSIYDVRVSGNRAYLSCNGQGLVVLDISNPAQPTRVGGYFSPSAFCLMSKVGNRLYAADEFNGFTILDVTDPAATPIVLGVFRAPVDHKHVGFWNVQVRKSTAYLSATKAGIFVVDVANPATPVLVNHYTEPFDVFSVTGLEVDGNILHVSYNVSPAPPCCGSEQLRFANFDISNPLVMTKIGEMRDPNGCMNGLGTFRRLTSSQGVTFAGWGPYIARRIDNRVPQTPVPLGGWTLAGGTEPCLNWAATPDPWSGTDMELQGTRLYTTDDANERLQIMDATNPASPTLPVLSTTQFLNAAAVGVAGARAVVAGYPDALANGLAVMDCSVPAAPQMTAMTRQSSAWDVIAEGDLVFAAFTDTDFGEEYEPRGGIGVLRYVCYANCDSSPANPVLTANDFQCFLNKFAAGDPYANCDGSTGFPRLTGNDFLCFINMFASGCS